MTRSVAPLLVVVATLGGCNQEPEHRVAADLAEQLRASRQAEFIVEPDGGVVLGRDAVRSLMNPCSRGFPPGLTGYWAPTTDELRELEERLAAQLAQDVPLISRPLNRRRLVVWRQYVGMLRGGVKVIYVNGMPAESLERHEAEWRRGQLLVCGGGASNFGIVYDTTTRQFDSFEGNGPI
ncbi:MAG: hypothetical protein R2745_17275 [Vicinamibacterales bacterium]